jgi:hypothetical protein
MNERYIALINVKRIKKKARFIRFMLQFQDLAKNIKWLQVILDNSLNQLLYTLTLHNDLESEIRHSVESVINWYSNDHVHPLKPLSKPVKDAFWGCYKVLFEAAGFPFNYNVQLQQFYNDGEVPEPNIDAVEFPKPDVPIQANAAKSKKASLLLEKKVFNLEPYTTDLKRLEKQVKVFCSNVLGYYEDGKLSQSKFDVLLSKFFEKIEDVYQSLDSEDRESLPNYLTRFAAVLGLSQNII